MASSRFFCGVLGGYIQVNQRECLVDAENLCVVVGGDL